MTQNKRAVVVTGLGAVSPFGVGVEALWEGLVSGRSAIQRPTFDTSLVPCGAAGEVKDFDPTRLLSRTQAKRCARFTQFALLAASEACAAAGIRPQEMDPTRIGISLGNGSGGFAKTAEWVGSWERRGWRGIDPLGLVKALPDMAVVQLSIALGIRGRLLTSNASCSSGNLAIGQAAELIGFGVIDRAIAGGSEAWLTPFGVANFHMLGALSTRDCAAEEASCPFDRRRDGFVPAEGSGFVVLEARELATARGAAILAEVAGFAANADAYHVLTPDPGGVAAATCITAALADAEIGPEDLDYVNAHGTSTRLNDIAETRALKRALGCHASRVPISSTKSMIGHTLGAAGAIEAVVAVKTIESGIIHATANLHEPDPDCDLDYVPNDARTAAVRTVLSNSFAFGGQNACVVFKGV